MEQDLNPEVVEQLRVAERSRSALVAAGHSLLGWEPYCLAFTEPDLLRREAERRGPPDPEVVRRLESLRAEIDPLLGKLRRLLRARDADQQDMLLGFIAGSPSARAAALRWIADPDRYAEEAVSRLAAIETFVDRCRTALRADAPAAPAAPLAQPGRARIALSWPAVPGALRYQVLRAEGPAGPFAPLATVEAPAFSDAGLDPGRRYRYAVVAVHRQGPSAPSPAVDASPASQLGAPEGLLAEPGDRRIRLGWSPVPGASHYRLMRSTTPGGPYSAVAQPAEASHLDEGLENGRRYHYVVRAVNDGGKGAYSAETSAAPVPPPPGPAALQAVAGNGRVQLRWSAVPGAVTYTIKRGLTASGPFLPLAGATGTSLTDPTVSNGTTYYYVVSAGNAAGESADSAPAAGAPLAPPPPPAGLRASAAPGRVTLEWEPCESASGYVVLRAELPGEGLSPLAAVVATAFVDDAVKNGAAYSYAVQARNAGGDSAPCVPLQVRPQVAPPPPPTGLGAQAGDGRVSLRWSASPGATSYTIRRAAGADAPFETVGSTPSTSAVDTGLENGRSYRYCVSAANAGGESAPGEPISALPLARPSAPAGLRAAPSSGQIALTWNAAPGATSYAVRRAASSAGPFTAIGRTPALAFIDATMPGDRPSVYVVVAENEGGESLPSDPLTALPLPPAPEAPGALVAAASSGAVSLRWTRAEGAFDYVVRRGLSAAGPFAALGTVPGTSFSDATAKDGTTYYYQVSALNGGGESAPSDVVSATPMSAPAVPEAPQAAVVDGRIRLTWAAVPGAEAYVVRRGEEIVGRVREASFTDEAGAKGPYTIAAANLAGESAPSAPAAAAPTGPPATPAGMAGSVGDGEVTLRWTSIPSAERYRIKRATTREGPFQTVAEVKEAAWTDRGVENGKTYFYTVRAINAAGKSGYSARLRATPNPRPGAPAGLAAAAGDGEVSLAWRPLDKAAGYKVKRSTSAEGPWTTAGTSRHPSWTDRALANGTTYWYAVTSVTAGVESEPSTPVAATPAADAQPPTLESLAAAPAAASPESLPPGVDAEKLEDLRKGEQLRGFFAETGQKFEPWELLTLLAEDGAGARKNIEIVLRLKEQAREDQFTAGAVALFERILKVRAAHGGFVRRLREFVGGLDLDGAGPNAGSAALEIALGFLVSAAKGRQRAELWIREGEPRRKEAAEFLFHAVGLARNYIAAMQDQNDG